MSTNNNAAVTSAVEVVTIEVSPAVAKAIRILARGNKKYSATQLGTALLEQVVKGRLKAKAEAAVSEYGDKWDSAASMIGADKMPMTRPEFVAKAVAELRETLRAISGEKFE